MNEINQIYYNNFGVAFHWKKNDELLKDRVQVIFKETGFYLTDSEIRDFAAIVSKTCRENACDTCSFRTQCHKFLLKTPFNEVDLAVSKNELLQIKDLLDGTLFNLELLEYLGSVCKN